MSAPGIGKSPLPTLWDSFSGLHQLPKPTRALAYLVLLAALTVVGMGALAATTVLIGDLTGSFSLDAVSEKLQHVTDLRH